MNIIANIISQMIYFVGIIFLFGYVISLLNRLFYRLVGGGRVAVYATGFIGTPIHELGHALMCVIFGHKIEEIKLFQINDADGVLGYVNHSYNPKNLYQRLGNYFIGIAPIVCGSLLLAFSMRFFLPVSYSEMTLYLDDLALLQSEGISIDWLLYAVAVFWELFELILAEVFTDIYSVIFLIIAICIALHMNLSGADIKGALSALPILAAILAVVNLVLGLIFKSAYASFTGFMNVAGSYLLGILLISLILSLFCIVAAFAVKGGASLIFKLKRR